MSCVYNYVLLVHVLWIVLKMVRFIPVQTERLELCLPEVFIQFDCCCNARALQISPRQVQGIQLKAPDVQGAQ